MAGLKSPFRARLAFRGVGFGSIEGGYIDDVARNLDDINRVETFGGRAALRWTPGAQWALDLSAVGQRTDGKDSQFAERDVGDLDRSSEIAQPFRNDYWLFDLVARKRWDSYEFTSSIGYARQYVSELFEGAALTDPGDPAAEPVFDAAATGFSQVNRVSMLTAEARLAHRGENGAGWVMAASLLRNRARVNREMGGAAVDVPLTGVVNEVEEATIYGEGTFEPAQHVSLTFGGRLTHSRLSGESQDVDEVIAFRVDPQARASRAETRFLPSLALAFRPTDELTLYARYQQGFRPGGIAVRREFIQRFRGDRIGTAEAGARYTSNLFDLALSGSWTRWTDIQADLVDGFGFPTTANVGSGRVLSAGLVSRWRPLDGLELDAAVYLNDSKVTDRDVVILPVQAGTPGFERLPNVADATARLGIEYVTPVSGDLDLAVRGHGRYVGKSTLGIGPILGRLQGDYLDTGVEARLGNERRGVSVAITNVLNRRGNRFALGSPFQMRDQDQITPLKPRSVRIGLDWIF